MASKIRKQLKKNDERQLKKLTYQLKFLREELLDCNDYLQVYQLELRDAVYAYLTELGIATDPSPKTSNHNTDKEKHDEPDPGIVIDTNIPPPLDSAGDEEESESLSSHSGNKELKKLFRQIVMLTHPDRVQHMTGLSEQEQYDRHQIYMQACAAFEKGLMDDLLELAIYLGVDVDVPLGVKISKLKGQINKADSEISSIKQAVEWVWGVNFGDNAVRARILDAVCREMGATNLDSIITLKFIEKYDSEEHRSGRRKVGERPDRKVGERPKPRS